MEVRYLSFFTIDKKKTQHNNEKNPNSVLQNVEKEKYLSDSLSYCFSRTLPMKSVVKFTSYKMDKPAEIRSQALFLIALRCSNIIDES